MVRLTKGCLGGRLFQFLLRVKQNYNLSIMQAFFKIFDTELDRALDPTLYLDYRISPSRLLSDLGQPSQIKRLVKSMQCPQKNPFKLMRILSVCNLLLIYGHDYYCLIEQNLKLKKTSDDWLNTKFIEPYYRFLIKCCASKDQYKDAKNCFLKNGKTLEGLFYSINMLKLLFKVVQKMPYLGRYYKASQNQLVSSAVQIIALQAQRLYGFFKACLNQILFRREYYIKNKDDERIMRGILADQLIEINQEMKNLFLDKYFYPLGKGIGVKIYRPQEQTPQFQKIINSIISNHENTERLKKHQQLQQTLFPSNGSVNLSFYQQTLLGGPLNYSVGKMELSNFKQLDELALPQQGQTPEKTGTKDEHQYTQLSNQKSQKQTNSGSVRLKGQEI